jgi:hypothetical protein
MVDYRKISFRQQDKFIRREIVRPVKLRIEGHLMKLIHYSESDMLSSEIWCGLQPLVIPNMLHHPPCFSWKAASYSNRCCFIVVTSQKVQMPFAYTGGWNKKDPYGQIVGPVLVGQPLFGQPPACLACFDMRLCIQRIRVTTSSSKISLYGCREGSVNSLHAEESFRDYPIRLRRKLGLNVSI